MELCFEADDVLFGSHRENFRVELTLGLSNLKDQFFVAVVKFEAVYAAFGVKNSDLSGMDLRHKVVLHFWVLIITLVSDQLFWSLAVVQNHVEEDAFTAIVVLKSYQASNIFHIFFFNLRRKLKRQACELNVGL